MCYNSQVARTWPLSQAAKTSPSHGEGMGSIPVGVTKKKAHRKRGVLSFCAPSRTHTAPRRGGRDMGSHFASKATGARSQEPRAKIFAAGEIPVEIGAHRKRGALSFCAPSRTHTAPRRGGGIWVRISRPKIGELARQAQGVEIFAAGEIPVGGARITKVVPVLFC